MTNPARREAQRQYEELRDHINAAERGKETDMKAWTGLGCEQLADIASKYEAAILVALERAIALHPSDQAPMKKKMTGLQRGVHLSLSAQSPLRPRQPSCNGSRSMSAKCQWRQFVSPTVGSAII
ncbi:hypothetical protein [Rhodoplanes sp. Z2-YC6860]|uniref:hypothetical protein n=1 Tax=Rhodoplanes sp. Z2-YC6860 TaxID=674703 RepID=UPI0012ED1476|nr:hypothetical protein [Rhodoplanes sp. Z2-YC6860]